MRQEALINYDIDEYDERFLRHLALGYTKDQITNLRGMPFGVKSLEKRQNELVQKSSFLMAMAASASMLPAWWCVHWNCASWT